VASWANAAARTGDAKSSSDMMCLMTDDIVQRIERFHFPRGAVLAERRNRGYTLYHALSGSPVARLRPTGRSDSVEILYWSAWKERWAVTGLFGRTVLPVDEALHFIAHEDIFWVLC
jgi:hypothetical protein